MNEIKTLTFYSNYFNHHQKALCDEFYKILGDGFKFIETMPLEGFRASMGWGENTPDYVLRTYESVKNASIADKLAGKQIVKEIYVPGRILNFVVK